MVYAQGSKRTTQNIRFRKSGIFPFWSDTEILQVGNKDGKLLACKLGAKIAKDRVVAIRTYTRALPEKTGV